MIDTIPFESAAGPLALFDAFTAAVSDRPAGAKPTYIYCGGSWTMSRGNGGLDSWTDERQPNSGRVQLTKWRSEIEQKVLTSQLTQIFPFPSSKQCFLRSWRLTMNLGQLVHGIVVRPGVLYGRSGSLPGMMIFQPALAAAKKGQKFEAIGAENQRLGTIHQDDLADLFLRVAERVSLLALVASNDS